MEKSAFMSKHIFYQTVGKVKYEVEIGWDRPLKHYYFVIYPILNDPEFGEVLGDAVASNMYLTNFGDVTLENIQAVCEDWGLNIPCDLLENVEDDRSRDAVNEEKYY